MGVLLFVLGALVALGMLEAYFREKGDHAGLAAVQEGRRWIGGCVLTSFIVGALFMAIMFASHWPTGD